MYKHTLCVCTYTYNKNIFHKRMQINMSMHTMINEVWLLVVRSVKCIQLLLSYACYSTASTDYKCVSRKKWLPKTTHMCMRTYAHTHTERCSRDIRCWWHATNALQYSQNIWHNRWRYKTQDIKFKNISSALGEFSKKNIIQKSYANGYF